jgi:hypothetical protein
MTIVLPTMVTKARLNIDIARRPVCSKEKSPLNSFGNIV